jgi:hypothetical protein
VTGLIRTPSSRCALAASSASLACRTFLPHKVFTNVVRPGKKKQMSGLHLVPLEGWESLPVPLAPQTIKLNCIPFFTFFFRRILCTRHRRLAALNYSKGCFLINSVELDEGSSIIPHSWETTWWAVRSIIARPEGGQRWCTVHGGSSEQDSINAVGSWDGRHCWIKSEGAFKKRIRGQSEIRCDPGKGHPFLCSQS